MVLSAPVDKNQDVRAGMETLLEGRRYGLAGSKACLRKDEREAEGRRGGEGHAESGAEVV